MKQLNELLQCTKFSVEKTQSGYRVWEGCEPWSTGLYTLKDVKRYLSGRGVL